MEQFAPETAKEQEKTEKEQATEKMESKKETTRKNPKRTVMWKCEVCVVCYAFFCV